MQKNFVALLLCAQISLAAQTATLRERAKPYLDSALAAAQSFVVVSAASAMPNLAPDSLAAALGSGLASQTATGTAPYPTSLGGISFQITDSAGAVRMAPLLYVSPSQINFLIPPGVAAGPAIAAIVNSAATPLSGTIQVQTVAPALFTANENGQGVVSATAYHTVLPTTLAVPIPVYQCIDVPGTCISVPLTIGVDVPIYVTVNASGLRGRSSDAALHLTIGGQAVPIQAINSQDDSTASAGLDQLFFPLPLSLRGSGEVDMVLTVDGTTSNTARINVM